MFAPLTVTTLLIPATAPMVNPPPPVHVIPLRRVNELLEELLPTVDPAVTFSNPLDSTAMLLVAAVNWVKPMCRSPPLLSQAVVPNRVTVLLDEPAPSVVEFAAEPTMTALDRMTVLPLPPVPVRAVAPTLKPPAPDMKKTAL